MAHGLKVTQFETGDCYVIALRGELDLGTVSSLDETVKRFPEESGKDLLLDLSGLDFMDSTGLNLVLRFWSRCQQSGNGFRLVPGAGVQRPLEISGLMKELRDSGGLVAASGRPEAEE